MNRTRLIDITYPVLLLALAATQFIPHVSENPIDENKLKSCRHRMAVFHLEYVHSNQHIVKTPQKKPSFNSNPGIVHHFNFVTCECLGHDVTDIRIHNDTYATLLLYSLPERGPPTFI